MILPVLLLVMLLGNEVTGIAYETIGCFKDSGNRAIPTLEGQDSILDGPYHARRDPKKKCYQAATKRGFKVFALQNGGWCASSADAEKTFDKYGKSSACGNHGEGGPWANQVYSIKDYEGVGFFKDTGSRAIPTIEGKDIILDGPYRDRKNAIVKCAAAARRRGFHMFALQHGGWCVASATAVKTVDKYGKSSEGGPWANNVYVIEDYERLGCYKDTGNRAIPTLEGRDSILDGSYRQRQNAIAKCAVAARKRGFNMFALQHGGWCASSATAEKTFDKYGKSGACENDREGGPWANNVYVIEDYTSLGCYKDTGNRAIPTLEGQDSILDGPYRQRQNAIAKCAVAARKRRFNMFALQHGGWCVASATAEKTFEKYGKSSEGGAWANNVYVIEDYTSLGCYKDTGNRAISTLEGQDSILDGPYRQRQNAIVKCAVAARRKGFHMFALQHGGWCAASATAEKTFDKYGKSGACENDREGGSWANNVYVFLGINGCSNNPCSTGGTCVDLPGSYRCDCKSGYTGHNCESDIDECSNNPCNNGAICVNIPGSHRCDCKTGYTGSSCEIDIDECATLPCKNNATCENKLGSYHCVCALGYTGSNCETAIVNPLQRVPSANVCATSPCQNGGSCVVLDAGYRCDCTPYFIGVNCEEENDEYLEY